MNSALRHRAQVVRRLLDLDGDVKAIQEALAAFAWDAEHPLVDLEARHLQSILARYRAGILSNAMVEAWANAVEGRDDVGIASPRVDEVLYELANPCLTEPLTKARAMTLARAMAEGPA